MKVLWFLLTLIVPAISFAAQEIPPPRLGPLADRILFLVALWVLILALLITLRWKILLADALFRMMPKAKETQWKEGQEEHAHPDPDTRPKRAEGKSKSVQKPPV